MTKDEALKMAIEYIEKQEIKLSFDTLKAKADTLNACYKALEQPAQEPVCWIKVENRFASIGFNYKTSWVKKDGYIPVYTHPHQWQGLTDDEILDMKAKGKLGSWFDIVRAIEQALRSKNT
jgi:hypothetical protein